MRSLRKIWELAKFNKQ